MSDSKYDVDACIEDHDARIRELEHRVQSLLFLLMQMSDSKVEQDALLAIMRPRSTTPPTAG
jgi:hypothetical protein